jgi:heterodisulfide reductase subunit C
MNKFGYNIKHDNQVDYDSLDRSMARLIEKNEPTFRICIQCGSCSGSCSAANFTNFSFRRLCLLIRRGIKADIQKEVSKCMLCGKCRLVCPRGVNTRNVILNIHLALQNKVVYEI